MSLQNSRYNLTANIFQQISSLLVAIFVPIFLGVADYAQITLVGVLIAFVPIADLGISIIYTRQLPALYASENVNQIRTWNLTVMRFRLLASLIFGGTISIYYFYRYQNGLNTFALFAMVVINIGIGFATINATVQSDFLWIRNITTGQSLGRLTTIPLVWISGIKGWFLGQLISICMVFFSRKTRTVLHEAMTDSSNIDWALIKANLPEGVILSMVATLWLQMTSSGRIYASFFYPDYVIAQYGIVGSIYLIIVSLGIAAFVPQTIKIYRLVMQDSHSAINYAYRLILYSAPIFMLASLVLVYVAPFAVDRLFPKYNVDKGLYAPLMLSLLNLAVMVTQGSLLIGMGKAKSYLTLIGLAVIAYLGFAVLFSNGTTYVAAAEAQMMALSTYSLAMVALVCYMARDGMIRTVAPWLACLPSITAPLLYFSLFH